MGCSSTNSHQHRSPPSLRRHPLTSATLCPFSWPPPAYAGLCPPPLTSARLRSPPQGSVPFGRHLPTSARLSKAPSPLSASAGFRRPLPTSARLRNAPSPSSASAGLCIARLRRPPQTFAHLHSPRHRSVHFVGARAGRGRRRGRNCEEASGGGQSKGRQRPAQACEGWQRPAEADEGDETSQRTAPRRAEADNGDGALLRRAEAGKGRRRPAEPDNGGGALLRRAEVGRGRWRPAKAGGALHSSV